MIICLNGPPGSGKTTASKVLQRKFGVVNVELATPFKKFVAISLGLDEKFCDENKDNRDVLKDFGGQDGVTIRELQVYTAAVIERADPAVWIKLAIADLMERRHFSSFKGTHYVIDAIGKRSQWKWLKKELGNELVLWRIQDSDRTKYWTTDIFTDMREEISLDQKGVLHTQEIKNAHPDSRNHDTHMEYDVEVSAAFNKLDEINERLGQ